MLVASAWTSRSRLSIRELFTEVLWLAEACWLTPSHYMAATIAAYSTCQTHEDGRTTIRDFCEHSTALKNSLQKVPFVPTSRRWIWLRAWIWARHRRTHSAGKECPCQRFPRHPQCSFVGPKRRTLSLASELMLAYNRVYGLSLKIRALQQIGFGSGPDPCYGGFEPCHGEPKDS